MHGADPRQRICSQPSSKQATQPERPLPAFCHRTVPSSSSKTSWQPLPPPIPHYESSPRPPRLLALALLHSPHPPPAFQSPCLAGYDVLHGVPSLCECDQPNYQLFQPPQKKKRSHT
ncbi:hypothetical protein EX30DRAFT_185914 [Ascodesmis nigricans]|uniref:Uncharacterized protein n=1 Tax=Ascodesmis nigricans TaxID=341454 RepID=A0A4S2N0G8_9PEZI|nr:hypothetical protein EX30DRAFT_185914 [Ascodesmis nigricans]